jgi:drug/metabolite transporter (DMT)-like permease
VGPSEPSRRTTTRIEPAAAAGSSFRIVGIVLATVGVIGFSLRPILIKLAYAAAPPDPVTLLALRMLFSLPFFVAAAVWLGRDPAKHRMMSRRDLLLVSVLGFLGYYLASFLDFIGLQYISAGLGRLLLFLYPTIVVALSAVFLRKPVTLRDVTALVLAYAGTALVLLPTLAAQHNRHLALGAALAFASAAVYAVYLVAGSQVVTRLGSMRFTAYAMSVASLVCIAQFALTRPLAALHLPARVYALSIAMAIASTVIPVFVTAEALRRVGAKDVAMIGALGPVSTIALGYIGLDEQLTAPQVCGVVLVLAGVVMVSLRSTRKSTA